MKRQLETTPPEVKFYDSSFGYGDPTTAGVIDVPMVGLAQGTTKSTRIGRKIRAVNYSLQGVVYGKAQTGAAPVADLMRILVVWDKQANGALPIVTDILQTAFINSFPNLDNLDRFVILEERWIRIDITAWGGTTPQSLSAKLPVHIRIPLDEDVIISANLGAQGEFRSGQLCILSINLGGQSNIGYTSRLTFTDE